MTNIKLLLWRVTMTYWLYHYRYHSSVLRAWRSSGQACWTDYFNEGYGAREAVLEDLSYAD